MDGSVGFNIDAETGEAVIVVTPPPNEGAVTRMSPAIARIHAAMLKARGLTEVAEAIFQCANAAEKMGAAVKAKLAELSAKPHETIH